MRRDELKPDDESADSKACRAAQRLLARLVGKTLSSAEDQLFRQHILKCSDCMASYRATIVTAARMGKTIREDREEVTRERRHTGMRERAIAATADRKRNRRFGLRLAFVPAGLALILLLFRMDGGDKALFVRWDGGSVRAAGQVLGADNSVLRLQPGNWCETGSSTHATIIAALSDEAGVFELGVETQLLIVDPSARAVRLERGELDVLGPCVVTTAHGVLEIEEGRAELRIRGGEFQLSCVAGSAAWIGPTGARVLAAGDEFNSSESRPAR